MNWSKDIESILSMGEGLHEFGINNWALSKEQALNALCKFKELKIPILGGDVYEKKCCSYEANYDNWYCNQNDSEELNEFIARSIIVAQKYIENYKSNKEIYFVIVPKL